MNRPKILIIVEKGIVHVAGATEDIQVFLADWDNEQFHDENYPDVTFDEQIVSDWLHPSEAIETDFEKYVRDYVQGRMQKKSISDDRT